MTKKVNKTDDIVKLNYHFWNADLFKVQQRQKGMVLILVLLIFSFAAIISAELSYQSHREVRRTANILHSNEAYLYALGGEIFAKQKLIADYLLDQQLGLRMDYLSEAWAVESRPYEVDAAQNSESDDMSLNLLGDEKLEKNKGFSETQAGEVLIIIEDLQARFNLNNVRFAVVGHASGQQQLEAVFKAVLSAGTQSASITEDVLPVGSSYSQENTFQTQTSTMDLVLALQDWLDENQDSALFTGGEDDYYQEMRVPYRTADQELIHVTELMAIKGFQEEDYLLYNLLLPKRFAINTSELANEQQSSESNTEEDVYYEPGTGAVKEPSSAELYWGNMQHYVSALPFPSKINVNTAPSIVLQALFSPEDANTIVMSRQDSPYQRVDDIFLNLQHIKMEDRNKFKPYLSVYSEYYLVTSIASLGETKFTLQSKLHRARNGKVRVLARDFTY